MPWICKVKSHWGQKGEVLQVNHFIFSAPDYPDLFEFVEEKSDAEVLKSFLVKAVSSLDECNRFNWWEEFISKLLIEKNAIKPEFLEKLRRGE